MREKEQAAG
uniref:Uncharacterized protein n=1 Tax=Arundo donax TaxID=35708 RepID=A0A0A9C9Y2_ARUDO